MSPSDFISKTDLLDLLDLIHDCTSCECQVDFQKIINKACSLLAADSVILCEFLTEMSRLQPTRVANFNFPEEWVNIYAERKLWEIDPIMQESQLTPGLQFWHNTYSKFEPRKKFLSLAEDFGLSQGYTFSGWQNSPKSIEVVSIAGRTIEKSTQADFILERIAPHLFLLLKKLAEVRMPNQTHADLPHLTPREREVISWIKEGKTSWEVSIILNISERTVNFHIRNLKNKLNAVSRGQAIAKAIHQGIIEL